MEITVLSAPILNVSVACAPPYTVGYKRLTKKASYWQESLQTDQLLDSGFVKESDTVSMRV